MVIKHAEIGKIELVSSSEDATLKKLAVVALYSIGFSKLQIIGTSLSQYMFFIGVRMLSV